jgi:hypothetical protein
MDDVTGLLQEARAAGLRVEADGDRLVVRGPKAAEPVALKLGAHKPAIMAALASSRWPAPHPTPDPLAARVAAFRDQLDTWTRSRRSGVPILKLPRVMARSGRCLSCGEPLADGRAFRCATCCAAVERVLGLPPVLGA